MSRMPDSKPSNKVLNKYSREIKPDVFVDVYDVLNAFEVSDPCLQHLIKKALACGLRGHKDAETDYQDIIDSAMRAKELYLEWEGHQTFSLQEVT